MPRPQVNVYSATGDANRYIAMAGGVNLYTKPQGHAARNVNLYRAAIINAL
jgi:hypothetical protein